MISFFGLMKLSQIYGEVVEFTIFPCLASSANLDSTVILLRYLIILFEVVTMASKH